MVAKLCAYGDCRRQATNRMRMALREFMIEGIKTNIPLHLELMDDAYFLEGGQSIHYLEQWLAERNKKEKNQ